MQFFIAPEQKKFFATNLFIEFEELFTPKELDVFRPYQKGRDLVRENKEIKKVLWSSKFYKMALMLLGKKALRYGFDEVLFLSKHTKSGESVEERSSIDPLALNLLVCLEGERERREINDHFAFPTKPGDGVFFYPTLEWSSALSELEQSQKFLLLSWAEPKARYKMNEKDRDTYYLKTLGYQFGETLRDICHPLFQ